MALVRRVLPLASLAVLAGATASCSSSSSATTSTTSSVSTSTSTTTTLPATTAPPTTAPPAFPAVVVEAMAEFKPLPSGAEAPFSLPPESGYVSAETGGIGGQDNVTLVVAAQPYPVDSPQLSATNSRELASFATTPTGSPTTAQSGLTQDEKQSIDVCQGPASPMTLTGGVSASSCPTSTGAAITWYAGPWTVQVVTLDGSSPSTTEADHLAGELAAALPTSDKDGMVSVVVPANASAGSSDTADIEWTVGADLYQVRSSDDPDGAVAVARAMRPYPG